MRRLLMILVVLAMVLGVMAPAVAARPDNAGGTWTYTPGVPVVEKTAGQNVFLSNTDTGAMTGTFDGTVTEEFVVVLHKKHGTYHGLVTFAGVVDGKLGTLDITTHGSGPWPPGSGDWSGRWKIESGTGELSNLRGQGSWWGPLTALEYNGKVFTG